MASKKPAKPRQPEKDNPSQQLNLYCINFYGSSLNVIKKLFKAQIQTFLRPFIFVIDLDDFEEAVEGSTIDARNKQINAVLEAIANIRIEYASVIQKLNENVDFNLREYWSKNIENQKIVADNISGNVKRRSSQATKRQSVNEKLSCKSLVSQLHNTIGQKTKLHKKHINDRPTDDDKVYIIIIGEMDSNFYDKLLSLGLSVKSMVYFVPYATCYATFLDEIATEKLNKENYEIINQQIEQLRKSDKLKPIAVHHCSLPELSECYASKHAKDIYDELIWGICYDLDILQEQYQKYYLKHFVETDVLLPPNVDLNDYYKISKAFNVLECYDDQECPMSATDFSTLFCYVNDLLDKCEDLPNNGLIEEPSPSNGDKADSHLITGHNGEARSSNEKPRLSFIIKILKYHMIFIDGSNDYLNNLLIYTDLHKFNNIQTTCTVYKERAEKYILPSEPSDLSNLEIYKPDGNPCHIPELIQMYFGKDSCLQRLQSLMNKYGGEFTMYKMNSECIMYIFKKYFLKIIENTETFTIPTRLCFRDFTLYEKEEFLMIPAINMDNQSVQSNKSTKSQHTIYNDDIFIRPKSLKDSASAAQLPWNTLSAASVRPMHNESKSEDDFHKIAAELDLFKGYNLDDTRQEIKVKTSKYFFEEGCLRLYEENWCFREMNKILTLNLNKLDVYLKNCNEYISNSIRLVTKNNIAVNITNQAEFCSNFSIIYPNGLGIHYNETIMHCKQEWTSGSGVNEELYRIFTRFGAIIVFYKYNNCILIMRYNGEIYRLHQNEYQNFSEIDEEASSEKRPSQQSSVNISVGGVTKQSSGFKKKNSTNTSESRSKSNSISNRESKSIDLSFLCNELKFLEQISSIYELSYKYVTITTAQGRVVTLYNGNIAEDEHLLVDESEDYFLNECYSKRSGDGVYMIWGQDSFKCYHADGTVFITYTIEVPAIEMDYFEHKSETTSVLCDDVSVESNNMVEKYKINKTMEVEERSEVNSSILIENISCEIEMSENDEAITEYKCCKWEMYHERYAAVFINENLIRTCNQLEVFARDDIYVSTKNEGNISPGSENKIENSEGDIIFSLGKQFQLNVGCNSCQFFINSIEKLDDNGNSVYLQAEIKYEENIVNVFKYLVDKISSFSSTDEERHEDICFIKNISKISDCQGFEFVQPSLITTGDIYEYGNCVAVISPVETANEVMSNNYEWFKEDMKKFKYDHKCPSKQPEQHFYKVTTFVKIPPLFRNNQNIDELFGSFNKITFKSLHPNINAFLENKLEKQLQRDANIYYSMKNWEKRNNEHKVEIFVRNQNLHLYLAMLRYKKFPNYFKYVNEYNSQVQNIEFSDIYIDTCQRKRHHHSCS